MTTSVSGNAHVYHLLAPVYSAMKSHTVSIADMGDKLRMVIRTESGEQGAKRSSV